MEVLPSFLNLGSGLLVLLLGLVPPILLIFLIIWFVLKLNSVEATLKEILQQLKQKS